MTSVGPILFLSSTHFKVVAQDRNVIRCSGLIPPDAFMRTRVHLCWDGGRMHLRPTLGLEMGCQGRVGQRSSD